MPSAVLIYNEKSGHHLTGGSTSEDVVRWLADGGITTTVLEGSVDAQVKASRESDADIVVVDGGDGTIRAAIEAHLDGGRPIGIIPGGTMNLLARDYGLPEDRKAAARAIVEGHTQDVDVGLAGERVFLHTALTGLPVRIGVHRENRRGRLSLWDKAALTFHALTTLPRDPVLTLTAEAADGGEMSLTSPSFALVIGTLEERLLPRPHRSSVTGGTLTVFAIHPETGADVARLVLRGAFGVLAGDPDVDRLELGECTLSGPRRRLRAMLDGEDTILAAPVTIKVRTGAIKVFCALASAERASERSETS